MPLTKHIGDVPGMDDARMYALEIYPTGEEVRPTATLYAPAFEDFAQAVEALTGSSELANQVREAGAGLDRPDESQMIFGGQGYVCLISPGEFVNAVAP